MLNLLFTLYMNQYEQLFLIKIIELQRYNGFLTTFDKKIRPAKYLLLFD